ncbi:MAG TPA: Xaa-Pro peptidase family protein [Ktedonobacterales bacterium]|nr:Xaa-Pro peptidase family protein [Ktedonobacterales bacterium]
MDHADYTSRLAQTRQRIAEAGLDGLLIASQFNRRYLTGLTAVDHDVTESAGMALVTRGTFGLITSSFVLNGVEDEIKPSGVSALLTDSDTIGNVLGRALREDGGVKKLGFEKDWTAYAVYARVRDALGDAVELVPTDDLIELVRARKDAAELETMRRAADIANRAFALLLKDIRVGMTERQIAATLDRHMVDLGASEPSFDTIVACGPGGAQPHWVPSDRPAQAGEPLLIDFGCRVDGYCSDLTRTIVIGEPDAKLREIYGIVRRAQDAALDVMRAGARRGRDIDAAARKVIDDAGYGKEFMHSLGHGVGMAVHELPVVSRLRVSTPEAEAEMARIERIEPGAVVTNEPGIYIPGWGGVRLEDMIFVGEDGVEVPTDRNPEQIVSIAG